ncbi:DEAD/DEAH box helicase [Kocuria rhizophila]|uniref:DEAD/DEAH box helicase n=1 Tax=Kocuria rhizophila TaxID=72000 RepID=UPI000C8795F6|nr:DEAD/DEAH box helicase [Kocuria rhizophila]MCT1957673.1 DEAD/DEAH box helicase [Kocuria rhizophila]MCT2073731.1 DEAD/DEAH box helicase [Kocuria rhizophila]MDR7373146.1 superfamily II DNA/RNA helicase [Kocuria rhizophila]PMR90835.1 DEAD/DEAH box helicase [Kocuria rhizophila]
MSHSFEDLGVPEALSSDLARVGITEAFPIQEKTLPDSLAGRDVLGRGRTGSGKTVAFALPLVSRLAGLAPGSSRVSRRANRPTGLVLAPTRELATQIDRTVAPLAKAAGLNTTVIFGGVSQKHQEKALANGVDIVVACPGRLEDLIKQGLLTLEDVRVTVLDEADHMADMGFLPVVTRILSKTPQGSQRLLFSATLDNGVDVLVKKFLKDPVLHSADNAQAAVTTMDHQVLVTHADDKQALIEALASGTGRRMMFTRTKYRAKKMAKKLSQAGIPAVDLQGNLSQGARDRNLGAFSDGDVRVLVATDVAARGVHVDDVELVVHIDPPAEHKSYLHRSGRTARAGASGAVITIATTEERSDVNKLMKKAGVTPRVDEVTPDSEIVRELVGERAELVAYAPAPTQQNGGGNRSGGRSTGRSGGRSGGSRQGGGRSGGGRGSAQRSGQGSAQRSEQGTGQGSGRSGGRSGGGRTDSARGGAPARNGGGRSSSPRRGSGDAAGSGSGRTASSRSSRGGSAQRGPSAGQVPDRAMAAAQRRRENNRSGQSAR